MYAADHHPSKVFTPSGPIVKSEDNEEIKKELDSMRKHTQDIEPHANNSEQYSRNTVSYTHLTLPTKRIV